MQLQDFVLIVIFCSGGSLAKVAYSSLVKKKSTMVFDEPDSVSSLHSK